MQIFVFGNPDIEMDALPIKMLPALKEKFPDIEFVMLDPNEDWDVPEETVIIDTVVGIDDVTVFHDLTPFVAAPSFSVHDFDAYANLRLLQKIGKLKKITIIGVPVNADQGKVIDVVGKTLA